MGPALELTADATTRWTLDRMELVDGALATERVGVAYAFAEWFDPSGAPDDGEDSRFPYSGLDGKAQSAAPDLFRVELRVGEVKACRRHPDADELLVEEVKIAQRDKCRSKPWKPR